MWKSMKIALAYTAVTTERDLDILSFHQKVESNVKELSEQKQQQPIPKAKIHKRSDFGL